ncbi:MAG: hypothetical protein M0Z51_07535 [Propionibacterium sp.]|nr:hypothetical protein [Propionibacterium sp.]
MGTDISETLAPNSDQLDGVDLAGGPRVFTVVSVKVTKGEQPVAVELAEFPRVWRPGKNMRRVLGFCWGTEGKHWTGRRVKLYLDPDVKYGGDDVGGVRIAAVSHIAKPTDAPIIPSRGKAATWHVDVLADERDWRGEADALTDADSLRGLWQQAPAAHRDYIRARATSLAGPTDE